ncbi:MAG: hypothetical protein ACPGU7_07450 [Gammaproteobacteria bacterium]
MSADALPWWSLLAASVLAGEALAFWLGYHWHRVRSAKHAPASIPAAAVREQIAAFDEALEGIDESLKRVDAGFEKIRQAEKDGSLRPEQQLRDQALGIAERLAAAGTSRNDLVRICSVTPGEAEMIQRVHGPRGGLKRARA